MTDCLCDRWQTIAETHVASPGDETVQVIVDAVHGEAALSTGDVVELAREEGQLPEARMLLFIRGDGVRHALPMDQDGNVTCDVVAPHFAVRVADIIPIALSERCSFEVRRLANAPPCDDVVPFGCRGCGSAGDAPALIATALLLARIRRRLS